MNNKGIVINMLCCNPSCSFSENKLIIKSPLNISSGGNCSFKMPQVCPKCKSAVELLNFVSGSVEIEADKIKE